MAKRDYGEELKAAVIAAVLAGQTINKASQEYNVPKGTISSWVNRGKDDLDQVRVDAAKQLSGGKADTEIGGLLAKYMTVNIQALIAQAEVMAEKDYLRKWDIQTLSFGHGILTDKMIRILEAMNRAEPESAED